MIILPLERLDLVPKLVQVFFQRGVCGEEAPSLVVEGVDVLGQVGDHRLQPLQLGDALAVLGDEPFSAYYIRSTTFMFERSFVQFDNERNLVGTLREYSAW